MNLNNSVEMIRQKDTIATKSGILYIHDLHSSVILMNPSGWMLEYDDDDAYAADQ